MFKQTKKSQNMNFEYSEKSLKIQEHLKLFMDKNILPIEKKLLNIEQKMIGKIQ